MGCSQIRFSTKMISAISMIIFIGACTPRNNRPISKTAILSPSISPTTPVIKETISPRAEIFPSPTNVVGITQWTVSNSPGITQRKDQIPICQYANNPRLYPGDLGINGIVVLKNSDGSLWYTLSGQPPQLRSIIMPDPKINSLAFSKDGQWAIGYTSPPDSFQEYFHYLIYLFSSESQAKELVLDLSNLVKVEQSTNCSTCSLQDWKLEWVNNRVIKVSAGFAETYRGLRPWSYYQAYYDIFQAIWLNVVIDAIPEGDVLVKSGVSPEMDYIFYINRKYDLILWSVQDKVNIWTKPLGVPGGNVFPIMEWSKDNQKVAFLTITDVGESTQILFLNPTNNVVSEKRISFESNASLAPRYFDWSPDGRELATVGWEKNLSDESYQPFLYLYDFEKGEYLFQCPIGPIQDIAKGADIFFSPDGKFIIHKSLYEDTSLLIHDLQNQTVYRLLYSGVIPVAWVREINIEWKK